jgi:tagatose 6-phosphate kinase
MILTLGTSIALARSMTFGRGLALDAVNRASRVRVAAAGKSTNVARVATTLGAAALATGCVGGHPGRELREELSSAGVAHDYVEVAASTRVCITVIDPVAQTATELVEETAALTDTETDALWAKLLELIPTSRVTVMSGTLAPGVPEGFYGLVARLCRDAGVDAIVDATGPALQRALPGEPWVVKPNRAELAQTLSRQVDSDDALRDGMVALLERGARGVAVTLGRDGAAITTDGTRFWRAQAPDVTVVSAIGSGDAFAAALAVGRERGLDDPALLAWAVACGSANAMTDRAGFFDPLEADRLRKLIRVKPF